MSDLHLQAALQTLYGKGYALTLPGNTGQGLGGARRGYQAAGRFLVMATLLNAAHTIADLDDRGCLHLSSVPDVV